MNSAKIRLSSKEMELVVNADWILTKNAVIQKVKHLLEGVQEMQQDILDGCKQSFPSTLLLPSAKISKGENYRGLPYLVLDNPRYFDRENIFAIRTLFWWGHFFSITLHLSGEPKRLFEAKLKEGYPFFMQNDFFICTGHDEWQHHFEKDNYTPVAEMSKAAFTTCIEQKSFLKLAQNIPLEQWNDAPVLLTGSFKQLISLLGD